MSKKTRKKSLNSATARAPSRSSAKRPAAKSKRPAATKSSEKRENRQTKAAPPPAKAAKRPGTLEAKQAGSSRSALAEGARAPAFHLSRDGGSTVSLADYAGQKLVVFFYPRADTPGCTREAIDFTRLSDAFAKAGTAVVGVSGDPLRAQEAFRNKHQLAVPLLSDEKHEMLRAYGAWGEKSMYGRTFEGILRTTVLIGADGRIIRMWRRVRVENHAEEVLAAAQAA